MKIGLVLSGGGMRGAAHIGAIKALEEHHIEPTLISGSSAGAIVGSLYAFGYGHEVILKFFNSIQLMDITKFALNKPGFLDAEKYYSKFKDLITEDDFAALKKELFVTATDVLKGELKVFNEGELIKPIIASAAFPGFFTPVKIGDTYYIDGGVLNNFPIEPIKDRCDLIIGVYVNDYNTVEIKELKHSFNIVERAFKLKSVHEDHAKFKDFDLIICPKQLSKYGTFDKKNINTIFKLGYDSTCEALAKNDSIREQLTKQSE